MKRIIFVLCCITATLSVILFSGCNYSKETEKILNIPVESYSLTYALDESTTFETVPSENSMRIYYFKSDKDGYKMISRDLIGSCLYTDKDQNPLIDNINYTIADNTLTVNEIAVEQTSLDYGQFKAYCLEYFGDTEDKHFKEDIYNLVQGCLSESKIHNIDSSIRGNEKTCYAKINLANLYGKPSYMDIVKKRLNAEQYSYFENWQTSLPPNIPKNVTFEILTDANYESVYPYIKIWHQGVIWIDINIHNFIEL